MGMESYRYDKTKHARTAAAFFFWMDCFLHTYTSSYVLT